MITETLEELVYKAMGEDVALPSSLSSDLRRCSDALQQIKLLGIEKRLDKFDEIMNNNRLLKTRFKKYKLYPGQFDEIISDLRDEIS